MIDFRYHLVSIVAVFLALAVGVGLGSTALRGPVLSDLGNNVDRLTKENKGLRSNVSALRTQNSQQQQFAAEAAPRLLKGRLTGQRIAVVSLPGASTSNREAVVKSADQAGATVVSQVTLTSDFTDPQSDDKMANLAVRDLDLIPGLQLPQTTSGLTQTSALLGAVLVGAQGVTIKGSVRNAVLQSLSTLGVASTQGDVTGRASAVVVVSGGASTGDNASARNKAAVTVVSQLAQSSPNLVVAGPSSADSSPVQEVRDDNALAKSVSTVDDVDQPTGRIATMLALDEQTAGRSGQYGTGSGATALMPSGT